MENRTKTSPRSPRSTKETQTPSRSPRYHSPSKSRQRSRPQTHRRSSSNRHPRRVPPPQQDLVLAGSPRRRKPRERHCRFWPFRGIQGSQIGAGSQGNCVRRVRERVWRYQCQGSYVWNAHGRPCEAYPGYLPETVVRSSCIFRLSWATCYWRLEGVKALYVLLFLLFDLVFSWRNMHGKDSFPVSLQYQASSSCI